MHHFVRWGQFTREKKTHLIQRFFARSLARYAFNFGFEIECFFSFVYRYLTSSNWPDVRVRFPSSFSCVSIFIHKTARKLFRNRCLIGTNTLGEWGTNRRRQNKKHQPTALSQFSFSDCMLRTINERIYSSSSSFSWSVFALTCCFLLRVSNDVFVYQYTISWPSCAHRNWLVRRSRLRSFSH